MHLKTLVASILMQVVVLIELGLGDGEQRTEVAIGFVRKPGFLRESPKADHVAAAAPFHGKFPAQLIQETPI